MSNLSETRVCDLCGSVKGSAPFKKVDQYDLRQCSFCGLVFLESACVDASLFYNDLGKTGENVVEYWGMPELYKKHTSVFEHYFEERWKRIHIASKFGGDFSLLDVGCGFGFWLSFCKKKASTDQSRLMGIDISQEALSYASKHLSLSVQQATIEDFLASSKEEFDDITLCDVLEHVASPTFVLKGLHSILKKDGLVYIQVPNETPNFVYPFKRKWGLPHHIWHFNFKSLIEMINACGFELENAWTGIQGVIGVYEKGGPSFLDQLLWKAAAQFKVGNRLQLLVRKKC